MRYGQRGVLTFLLLWLTATVGFAQTPATAPARPAYQALRFDEDWSFLKDPAKRSDRFDPVKYIKLNSKGWFVSLGGEARLRYEGFGNSGFGAGPQDPNGYLLQRYLLHADFQMGRVRVFTQMQSGISNGRIGGPRASDSDKLEIHQAFFDVRFGKDKAHSATLRIGRQEFEFGSGRLISASELLNVRRAFDGVRISGQSGAWTYHTILAHPVPGSPGYFDDATDHTQSVWGVGVVHPLPKVKGGNGSLYYIGFARKVARFDAGVGEEVRHTLGTRLFGTKPKWDYNYEAIYQWGTFRSGPIRAWGMSTDTGRSFAKAPLAPRLGIKADLGSGDKDATDNTLQSFNPLFPSTAYSGKIGLLGPTNIMDLEPGVRLRLNPKVIATAEWGVFWRESTRDGIYGISLAPFKSGQRSLARYIANQPDLQVAWLYDRHLSIVGILTQFRAATFIKETPPSKSVSYGTIFVTYKF